MKRAPVSDFLRYSCSSAKDPLLLKERKREIKHSYQDFFVPMNLQLPSVNLVADAGGYGRDERRLGRRVEIFFLYFGVCS